MSRFVGISAVLSMVFVVTLAAEEPQDGKKKRQDQIRRLIDRFDTNQNGRLDPSEREAARKAREKFRSSRAGKTGRQRDGQKTKKGRPNQQNRARLLRRFDANQNGRLDPPEIAALRKAMGNRDRGKKKGGNRRRPAGQEKKKRPGGNERANVNPQVLRRFDENKNGRLDPPELAKIRQMRSRNGGNRRGRGRLADAPERANRVDQTSLLKRFDANNNGKLDENERQKALTEMRKK